MTTNNRLTTRFDITNGPGKFDLMVGLMDGKLLTFSLTRITEEVRVTVYLYSIGLEDGSHESWLIKGRCHMPDYPKDSVDFKGYYHSRNRRGYVDLKDEISQIGELLAYGGLRKYQVKTPNR